MVVMTSFPNGGRIKKQESRAIFQPVRMNGYEEFARNRKPNVVTALGLYINHRMPVYFNRKVRKEWSFCKMGPVTPFPGSQTTFKEDSP